MRKRYISYSEIYTYYEKGLDEYKLNYIMGFRTPPTKQMKFGTIVHNMLAEPGYDYLDELKKEYLEPDYPPRILEKIKNEVPTTPNPETKLFVDTPHQFSLFAGIDGAEKNKLIEIKTGASLWTQERADQHEQIDHYLLTWQFKYGNIPKFELITINSKNGRHQILETTRTEKQLTEYENKLIGFKEELIAQDLWHKKCKFNDRIEITSADSQNKR